MPVEVRKKIDSLRRAYLWAGCDKVTGGKCKVNWDLLCKPKIFGGLGILNLEKFATALRLRWLWYEWADPPRTWLGLGSPCTTKDRDLFATATRVTVGDGNTTKFWESPWLEGLRPMDNAPKIFELSRKKSCSVRKALTDNNWITQINTQQGISLTHIQEVVMLWERLADITLADEVCDSITWKLSVDGVYSASLA